MESLSEPEILSFLTAGVPIARVSNAPLITKNGSDRCNLDSIASSIPNTS